eukprot:Hpha_TRINITY_DN12940_c0_g1::TRINITY_DN12940_c0_g1_i1::g.164548::m.164548
MAPRERAVIPLPLPTGWPNVIKQGEGEKAELESRAIQGAPGAALRVGAAAGRENEGRKAMDEIEALRAVESAAAVKMNKALQDEMKAMGEQISGANATSARLEAKLAEVLKERELSVKGMEASGANATSARLEAKLAEVLKERELSVKGMEAS